MVFSYDHLEEIKQLLPPSLGCYTFCGSENLPDLEVPFFAGPDQFNYF